MIQIRRKGFTLVEMLTVLAVTAILLTIITVPIFQSFSLVRAAEAFADAQDQGRFLTEKISRDISNAASVRGNQLVPTTLNGANVSLPSNSLVVTVPGKNGVTTEVALPWTKLDIVQVAQSGQGSSGAYVDPVSGKIDPTLLAPKGQSQLPVAPSSVLKRYFVGLRDPFSPYNDAYSGKLMKSNTDRDNLYVLYAAVAQPLIATANGQTVNSSLFDTNSTTQQPVYDDPRFFVADRDSSGAIVQDAHNARIYHWLGKPAPWENQAESTVTFAHATVQTEVSRYDMIQVQTNGPTGAALFDGNIPRLTPLVQFRPTVISNDPAAGAEAVRLGQESDNAVAIAPDVYQTQYGLWNNAIVRDYPAGFVQGGMYQVGYIGRQGTQGFGVFVYNPANGAEFTSGDEVFDTFTYENATAMGQPYPFTSAALVANANPISGGWLGQAINPATSNDHTTFTPYDYIAGTGKIITSFGINEVGTGNGQLPNPNLTTDPDDMNPNRPNLPTLFVSQTPQSVVSDNGVGASFSPTEPNYDINRAFNLAWNEFPDQQPNLFRFIDLRVVPNEDGTYSPLYPGNIAGTVTGFQMANPNGDGSYVSRCSIVPGSEVVYGPDQVLGPNYGQKVRYTRTTHRPGPDQYRINYVDQQEPSLANGTGSTVSAASYQAILGLTNTEIGNFNPTTYDGTNFTSAVIQPRYKAGYVELNSDPNVPLPQGYYQTQNGTSTLVYVPFKVSYRFQFTKSLPPTSIQNGGGQSDVFAVDYDTRQLMEVLLTIRNYPQSNLPNPQSITLKATATIRNTIR